MKIYPKSIKFVSILVVSIILSLSVGISTSAYELWGLKWSSYNIKYYYDNYNSSRAKYYLGVGAGTWNPTDVNYSFNAAYNVYSTEAYYPNETWDGMTTQTHSGNYFTSVVVMLNNGYASTWNSNGALQSVAVHEFGHAFGLAHETSPANCIMNQYTWGANSRYGTYGLTEITADDWAGAN